MLQYADFPAECSAPLPASNRRASTEQEPTACTRTHRPCFSPLARASRGDWLCPHSWRHANRPASATMLSSLLLDKAEQRGNWDHEGSQDDRPRHDPLPLIDSASSHAAGLPSAGDMTARHGSHLSTATGQALSRASASSQDAPTALQSPELDSASRALPTS